MSDFNTCPLKQDGRASRLCSIANSANLHVLSQGTHSFSNYSPSLPDLILVSSLDHVDKHRQYPADAISSLIKLDHQKLSQ